MHIFYIILYVLIFNMCGGKKSENFFGSLHTPQQNCVIHAAAQNAKFLPEVTRSEKVSLDRL